MKISGEAPQTVAAFLGKLSIHPFWGIPILLLVLWLTYQFVGVFGAQTSVKFLEETVFAKWFLRLSPIWFTVSSLSQFFKNCSLALWRSHHGS